MDNKKLVFPSVLVDSTLPDWIRSPDDVINEGVSTLLEGTQVLRTRYRSENNKNFVNFLEKSAEASERKGYGQDLLQNLLNYKDFDTYTKKIVQYDYLKVDGRIAPEEKDLQADYYSEPNILAAQPVGSAKNIIITGISKENELILSAEEEEYIELVDSYGFPEENGVVMIDDEIIFYRRKEGNFLYNLQRGACATTILPSFRDKGEFIRSEPAQHFAGSVVVNLSVLFLVSMLDTIHKTYAVNIDSERVVPEVNRSTLLQNIKDFFRSKGSKLGIKALFKFLFNETDVDVLYPGDRMIKPSESTFTENLIVRTVPMPWVFTNPDEKYTTPENCIGVKVQLKSYNSDDVYAEGICDYVSEYQYNSESQYEIYLNKDNQLGNILSNPITTLSRDLQGILGNELRKDHLTITVSSTMGFPERGVLFIEDEAIYYNRKTSNQFLDCKRGYIGVEAPHPAGSLVYGPYYLEMRVIDSLGDEYVSRSWPKGLVKDVDIIDEGLYALTTDPVQIGEVGLYDPREQSLCTIKSDPIYSIFGFNGELLEISNDDEVGIFIPSGVDPSYRFTEVLTTNLRNTFIENLDDGLASLDPVDVDNGTLPYHGDRTYGIDSVYFDDDYVFVSSSGLPPFTLGPFNKQTSDQNCLVGPFMEAENFITILPRRHKIQDNRIDDLTYTFKKKGTDVIGVFVDGVRAYSNVSPEKVVQGSISKFNIINGGKGYITPTLLVNGKPNVASAVVEPTSGAIIDVKIEQTGDYTSNPQVDVTSGYGSILNPVFDNYGRLTRVGVVANGQFYYDSPIVQAVDGTGKGKGALLSAQMSDGEIIGIEIINPGIDYDAKATEIVVQSVGSGAEIRAVAEYYEINRPVDVISRKCTYSTPAYQFDQGNGFLYERPGFTGLISSDSKTTYGYTVNPRLLRKYLNDIGESHSPILGWAFDGNPIYGPYGFSNGIDAVKGITQQKSGYRLRTNRNTIIPAEGTNVGSNPPSTTDYPLGSFVQDYEYAIGQISDEIDPDRVDEGYLATQDPQFLNTQDDQYIEIYRGQGQENDDIPNYILDRNNGKVCNTPEFPKELYPEGVYCYFITLEDDGETPAFPYIIGETFESRPLSQNYNQISEESVTPLPRSAIYSSVMVDDVPLVFDFSKAERLRNGYLESPEQEIEMEISSVTEGSVNKLVIQDNETPNRSVGDYLFFDNTDTSGGGAQGKVSKIIGGNINRAGGEELKTTIKSQFYLIDLSYNYDEDAEQVITFTLNSGYTTQTFGNGSTKLKVVAYNRSSATIVVESLDGTTPLAGDRMYDWKDNIITLGEVDVLEIPKNHKELWVESTEQMNVGDLLEFDNGSLDENYYPNEVVKIQEIRVNNTIKVIRNFSDTGQFPIPPSVDCVVLGKYLYRVDTEEQHNMMPGDVVTISGSAYEGLNGDHIINTQYQSRTFEFFVDELYPPERNISYTTTSASAVGFVGEVELTSPGAGYNKVPVVKGIYNRFVDRAIVKPIMSGMSISGFEVESGGNRYDENVRVMIVDFANSGSGAIANAVVEGGSIVSVDIDGPHRGDNYVEPIVYLVQPQGKYLCSSNDIGRIKSMKVVNPGRDVTVDGTKRPEVITPTRCVVKYIKDNGGPFQIGDLVYQGHPELFTATARVAQYDPLRQVVTLIDVVGNISDKEYLYKGDDIVAEVISEGDSHIKLNVNGSSLPYGFFVNDQSKLSEEYPVIQDSHRYQWFSYVISSDLQQVEYDNFVEEIVHPSGFIRFADLTIRERTKSTFKAFEDGNNLTLIDFDLCAPRVLITSASELPVISVTKDGEKYIMVQQNLCIPEYICEYIDGGASTTLTYYNFLNSGNSHNHNPYTNVINCGTASTIYCDEGFICLILDGSDASLELRDIELFLTDTGNAKDRLLEDLEIYELGNASTIGCDIDALDDFICVTYDGGLSDVILDPSIDFLSGGEASTQEFNQLFDLGDASVTVCDTQ